MTPRKPKNPKVPPVPLTFIPSDLIVWTEPLWRIHTTAGSYATSWNNLREYGPIKAFRWEPHPSPLGIHLGIGVSYTSPSYATAFAEVFQGTRMISLDAERTLSAWIPTRPLRLLDLTSFRWPLRHQASASLPQQHKNICRSWAKEINEQLGTEVDGLFVNSTVVGTPVVVLFSRSATAFPEAPDFSRNLAHIDVYTMARRVAKELQWQII